MWKIFFSPQGRNSEFATFIWTFSLLLFDSLDHDDVSELKAFQVFSWFCILIFIPRFRVWNWNYFSHFDLLLFLCDDILKSFSVFFCVKFWKFLLLTFPSLAHVFMVFMSSLAVYRSTRNYGWQSSCVFWWGTGSNIELYRPWRNSTWSNNRINDHWTWEVWHLLMRLLVYTSFRCRGRGIWFPWIRTTRNSRWRVALVNDIHLQCDEYRRKISEIIRAWLRISWDRAPK